MSYDPSFAFTYKGYHAGHLNPIYVNPDFGQITSVIPSMIIAGSWNLTFFYNCLVFATVSSWNRYKTSLSRPDRPRHG